MIKHKSWITLFFLIIITNSVAYSAELPNCELTFSIDFDDGTIKTQVGPEELRQGTISSGTPVFNQGIRGLALKTAGDTAAPYPRWWTSSQTHVGVHSVEMPFTVSFWLKFEDQLLTQPAKPFFGWSKMHTSGYQIMQTTGSGKGIVYYVLDFPNTVAKAFHLIPDDDSNQFKLDEWYHFVASWDTVAVQGQEVSRLSLYRDGVFVTSQTMERLLTTEDIMVQGELFIGLNNCATALLIDELKFWTGQPLSTDISNIYKDGYPFPNQVEVREIIRNETTNWGTKITWVAPEKSIKGEVARFFNVYRRNEQGESTLVDVYEFLGSPGEEVTWIDDFTSDYDKRDDVFHYFISAVSYEGGNDSHSLSEEIFVPSAGKAEITGLVKCEEESIADADVIFTFLENGQPTEHYFETTTTTEGSFEIILKPGTYSVEVSKAKYVSYYEEISFGSGEQEISIELPKDEFPTGPVKELIANSKKGLIELSWKAPGDEENPEMAAGYGIYRSQAPIEELDGVISGELIETITREELDKPDTIVMFKDYDVSSDMAYYYGVCAYDIASNRSILVSTSSAVKPLPVPFVTLVSPEQNSIFYGETINFIWNEVEDGNQYLLEYSIDPHFEENVYSDTYTATQSDSISTWDWEPGAWYWRVAVRLTNGAWGEFSQPFQCTKKLQGISNLKVNAKIGSIELTWNAPEEKPTALPASYKIYRSEQGFSEGVNVPYIEIVVSNFLNVSYKDSSVQYDKQYFYAVTLSAGEFESEIVYTTEGISPLRLNVPRILAPFNGSAAVDYVEMEWSPIPGITKYLLQLCKDTSFNETDIIEIEVEQTEYTLHVSGMEPGNWYWRVAALSEGARSEFSPLSYFTRVNTSSSFGASFVKVLPATINPLGENSKAEITLVLNQDSDVTITIYDLRARLISNLKQKERMAKGLNIVEWFGKNTLGDYVKNGIYIVGITIESPGQKPVRLAPRVKVFKADY